MRNLRGMGTISREIAKPTVFLLATCLGCAGTGGQAEIDGDNSSRLAQINPRIESLPSGMVRFTLGLSSAAIDAVYVSVNDEGNQPGWVRVFRGTERIYLKERCEIEDCGRQAAVCGAAIPMIQQIKRNASSGSIEVIWDGRNSITDSSSDCEIRQQSPEGQYKARFCYALEAEFEPTSDPAQPVPGRLIQPTCVEQSFILPTSEIDLRL